MQAAVVTLGARHRISRRAITELAGDLFGVTLCAGAVDAICQRASDALAGPHCQLQGWVLDRAVHVDETGWRTRREGRALWTATTPEATFLQIAAHWSREQFDALIGTSYPGIVVSDRWNGFSHLDGNQRQVCWSHLQRDFRRGRAMLRARLAVAVCGFDRRAPCGRAATLHRVCRAAIVERWGSYADLKLRAVGSGDRV